jgi:hypothetical protein
VIAGEAFLPDPPAGWDLKIGERLAQEGGKFVRADDRTGADDYNCRYLFTEIVIWQPDDGALDDPVVSKELLLYVSAGNVFTASDDDVLGTARDVEVTVGVDATKVTGVDPSLRVDDAVMGCTPVAVHLGRRPRQYLAYTVTVWTCDSELGQRQGPTDGARTLHKVASRG